MLSIAVSIFLQILTVLILARVLSSWFRPRYRTSSNSWFFTLDDLVWRATEPLLAPIRNLMPGGGMMGLDLAPIIVLILIRLLGSWLVRALIGIGI